MSDLHSLLQLSDGPPRGKVALATVVATQGSSYRKRGARLLLFEDGRHHGLLSGGCLEEVVAERSAPLFATGHPLRFRLDTRISGCDGSLDITVELVDDLLVRCWDLLQQRDCRHFLNTLDPIQHPHGPLTRCQPGPDPQALLSEPLRPLPRLFVIGGGSDSLAMVALARAMNWSIEWLCHPEHRSPQSGALALAPLSVNTRYRLDDRSGPLRLFSGGDVQTGADSKDGASLGSLALEKHPRVDQAPFPVAGSNSQPPIAAIRPISRSNSSLSCKASSRSMPKIFNQFPE